MKMTEKMAEVLVPIAMLHDPTDYIGFFADATKLVDITEKNFSFGDYEALFTNKELQAKYGTQSALAKTKAALWYAGIKPRTNYTDTALEIGLPLKGGTL